MERDINSPAITLAMETVSVTKKKPLSDSEQTIAEIRALRWQLSKKYRTWEDMKRLEREVDDEMKRLRVNFRKAST